jgi:hypothetical protein
VAAPLGTLEVGVDSSDPVGDTAALVFQHEEIAVTLGSAAVETLRTITTATLATILLKKG